MVKNRIACFLTCGYTEAGAMIESWFIADWEHGFGYIYNSSGCVTDIEIRAKQFFVHHLKRYIYEYILKEYSTDIENFGYFNQVYYKLSDQVIEAIQTGVNAK